ncbi:MAG: hypothetical protein IPI17_17845 [Nitrosomonas sp.]|nr:hypothetical protein [Nitrosomonas sp.]
MASQKKFKSSPKKNKALTQESITTMLDGVSEEIVRNVFPMVDEYKLGRLRYRHLIGLEKNLMLLAASTILGVSLNDARKCCSEHRLMADPHSSTLRAAWMR